MADPKIVERVEIVNLDQAQARAERMLDGGTFNRELVGRDVPAMARELRMWREKYAAVAEKAR